MTGNKSHNMGSGGNCICPWCGYIALHKSGMPCQDEYCPHCNRKLLREGSEHHKLFLKKHPNIQGV
jgi:hypothetical protein